MAATNLDIAVGKAEEDEHDFRWFLISTTRGAGGGAVAAEGLNLARESNSLVVVCESGGGSRCALVRDPESAIQAFQFARGPVERGRGPVYQRHWGDGAKRCRAGTSTASVNKTGRKRWVIAWRLRRSIGNGKSGDKQQGEEKIHGFHRFLLYCDG